MSLCDSLGLRRLYWYSGHGVAQFRWDAPAVELKAAPELGFPYIELDFEPGICAQVRPGPTESAREMTPSEISACLCYLKATA